MTWWNPFSWLKFLFGKEKSEKYKPKTTRKERIEEKHFKKVQSELFKLRNELDSIEDISQLKEVKRKLEKIRGQFRRLSWDRQKHLSGIFEQIKDRIKALEKIKKAT